MKKIIKFSMFALMAGSLIFLLACDKDDENNNNDGNGGGGGDTSSRCQLTSMKFTYIDECEHYEDNYEDVDFIEITYNDDGTVKKGVDEAMGEEFIFHYNDNKQLIKVEIFEDSELDGYFEYTWDENKITAKFYHALGGGHAEAVEKNIFFMDNNKIIRAESYFENGYSWEKESYSEITWQGNNIVKQEAYLVIEHEDWKNKKSLNNNSRFRGRSFRNHIYTKIQSYDFKDGDTKPYVTITFNYDNKNNPTYNIQEIQLMMSFDGLFTSASQNNVLDMNIKIQITEDFTYEYSHNYSYIYNDYGFPTKSTMIEYDEEVDCIYTDIIEYTYNCN